MQTAPAGPVGAVDPGTILFATHAMVLRVGTHSLPLEAHDAFRFDAAPSGDVALSAAAILVRVARTTRMDG